MIDGESHINDINIRSNITSSVSLSSSVSPQQSIIPSFNHSKILLCIPGHGFNVERYQTISLNLRYLYGKNTLESYFTPSDPNSSASNDLLLECLIFLYQKPLDLSQEIELNKYCQLEYFYHGNYAIYLKSLGPILLKASGYSHIFILLDDVRLTDSFKLDEMLKIMIRNNLQMISPGIVNASMTSTTPYKLSPASTIRRFKPRYTLGHYAEVIEIFATIFTLDAWNCWWEMIQPNLNPSGWGYDLCYSYFCPQYSRSLGVVDNQIAIHQKKFGRLRVDTTHLSASSLHQMHPGAQKQYWLDEISSIRNKTARCKDIERHSRGKPLQ